jgi:hypothetical protein
MQPHSEHWTTHARARGIVTRVGECRAKGQLGGASRAAHCEILESRLHSCLYDGQSLGRIALWPRSFFSMSSRRPSSLVNWNYSGIRSEKRSMSAKSCSSASGIAWML